MGAQTQGAVVQRLEALLAHPFQGQESPGRLRHLAFVENQKGAVHPGIDPAMTETRLGLGDLVGVMDRDMVDAAAMDVDARPQIAGRHRRAFDMPARETAAPGTVPTHDLTRKLGFGEPQDEIGARPLALVDFDPG